MDYPEKCRDTNPELSLDTLTHSTLDRLTPSPRDACLVYIYPIGPEMGRRYVLRDAPVLIGRESPCDVTVEDRTVSRLHARIHREGQGYCIEDLGSTNGTFVNEERVARQSLRDGDYLHIGKAIYRFLAGGNIEAAYHEEIHRLAIIDGLTGVYNKRYLLEFLEREVIRAQRYQRALTLLMLDLDHFKAINDTSGHLAGDAVLRELAGVIKKAIRKESLLTRYGGEEFAVVLPETIFDHGLLVAERIRSRVAEHPFQYQGHSLSVTVSVGGATMDGDAPFLSEELIRQADEQLYLAKHGGRNRVAAKKARIESPVLNVTR